LHRLLNGTTLAKDRFYRPDIDGLRAIAILGVVAFHADKRWAPGGFVGVDIFFVISGYLITQLILRGLASGTFSLLEFYQRRIRRIMPALVAVLLATWLIGWIMLAPSEYGSLGEHISAASVFASNFLLIHETGYFDTAAELKPLLHLWSLAVEEQFYLIWPALLLVLWRYKANTLLLLGIFGALSFGLTAANVDSQSLFSFFSPLSRAWELTIGALLASREFEEPVASRKPVNRAFGGFQHRDIAACAGFALIFFSIAWIDQPVRYPNWTAALPTVGTGLLIVSGPNAWINRRILSRSTIVGIGLISYPLYLWHWPLLSYARIAVAGDPSLNIKLTAISAAAVLAGLTYLLIERPIRHGKRFTPTVLSATLVLMLCAAGGLGLATQWNHGFIFRLPADIREIAGFHYDARAAYRGGDCLLSSSQDERSFGADCVALDVTSARPLVLLWGDSHAAHLYPGLRRLQGTLSFSLAQLTQDSCPPILDVDFNALPNCRQVNDFIIRRVGELKPDIVVLAASWWGHPQDTNPSTIIAQIERSIERLKELGVGQIVLVGPVPVFNPSLPKALMSFYAATGGARPPERMKFALNQLTEFDDALRKAAAESSIIFVSPDDVMCNAQGCLTRIGDDPGKLTAFDSAHLTDEGSSYLVEHIASTIKWN
jgi:peptidoglycan/LPS O-acetylase OafA/YrhL